MFRNFFLPYFAQTVLGTLGHAVVNLTFIVLFFLMAAWLMAAWRALDD